MSGKLISADTYQNSDGGRMQDFHCHDYYELSLILDGDMTVMLESGTYKAGAGCVIMSPPFVDHFIFGSNNKLYRRKNLLISLTAQKEFSELDKYSDALFGANGRGTVVALNEECVKRVEMLLELIETPENALGKEIKTDRDRMCAGLVLNLISAQCDKLESDFALEAENYICAVLRYISENFASSMTAAEIAEQFYVSRTKLMTDFKKAVGTTLSKHITSLRVERAKALLLDGAVIDEIADACGFGDTSNFFRVFKATTGTTPRGYCKI